MCVNDVPRVRGGFDDGREEPRGFGSEEENRGRGRCDQGTEVCDGGQQEGGVQARERRQCADLNAIAGKVVVEVSHFSAAGKEVLEGGGVFDQVVAGSAERVGLLGVVLGKPEPSFGVHVGNLAERLARKAWERQGRERGGGAGLGVGGGGVEGGDGGRARGGGLSKGGGRNGGGLVRIVAKTIIDGLVGEGADDHEAGGVRISRV